MTNLESTLTQIVSIITAFGFLYYKIKQWNGELPEYFVSGTDTVLPILGQAAAGSGSEAAPAAP